MRCDPPDTRFGLIYETKARRHRYLMPESSCMRCGITLAALPGALAVPRDWKSEAHRRRCRCRRSLQTGLHANNARLP